MKAQVLLHGCDAVDDNEKNRRYIPRVEVEAMSEDEFKGLMDLCDERGVLTAEFLMSAKK